MERVKIFTPYYNTSCEIEEMINKWLTEMGNTIEITRTMQSG